MKYLKKTTALLLSVLLLFSAMVTGFTVTADGNTATITAAAVEAQAGANVDVPVTVDTTGLTAAIFTVTVDGLVVDSYAFGDDFTEVYTDVYNNEYTFAVTAKADADVAGTATVVTLNVAVPANAEAGTVLGVTVSDATAADYAEDYVAVATANGSVTVKAATPDVPECEHEWEFVTATPAEGTSAGSGIANQTTTKVGSISLKCSLCEEEVTKEVQYYGRAKCFTAAALYESAIILEFAGRADRLAEAGEYTNGFVRFEHILPSGTPYETCASIMDAKTGTRNGRESKIFEYPVASYQLSETVNTTAFIEVDGVWYSGETFGYSIRSYADEVLPYDTVSDTERALIVNMLRYGSRMQTFKGYNIEALADADLPAEYAAMIIETDPTIEGTYSRDESIGNDCLQVLTSYTLFMDSRTEVRIRVRSDRYTAEPAKSDFVIEANWTSSRNATAMTEKYYNEAIASEGDNVYTQDSQSSNAGRWEFYFAGCPAYDFRQVVTFSIYDPEDQIDVSNKFSASFEQLIAAGIAADTYGETEVAMYKAMMNYSDAAKAHFCK